MFEIRFHGRGGQGAVTAAIILVEAAAIEGRYVQAFPAFGPERRGAPVVAYARISDQPIEVNCGIYKPDAVVVLDASVIGPADALSGLKNGGWVVINAREGVGELVERGYKVAAVDATKIALEKLGAPIVNTAILGAVSRALGVVGMEALEKAVEMVFTRDAQRNVEAMRAAYESTQIFGVER